MPKPPREKPEQIDLEPYEYRTEPRKGEPFFAPGGLAFLIVTVLMVFVGMWFSDLFEPVGQWAGGVARQWLR